MLKSSWYFFKYIQGTGTTAKESVVNSTVQHSVLTLREVAIMAQVDCNGNNVKAAWL